MYDGEKYEDDATRHERNAEERIAAAEPRCRRQNHLLPPREIRHWIRCTTNTVSATSACSSRLTLLKMCLFYFISINVLFNDPFNEFSLRH